MARKWLKSTSPAAGTPMVANRVRIMESGIAIEGEYELPPLVR
jgi:hypothetical protein